MPDGSRLPEGKTCRCKLIAVLAVLVAGLGGCADEEHARKVRTTRVVDACVMTSDHLGLLAELGTHSAAEIDAFTRKSEYSDHKDCYTQTWALPHGTYPSFTEWPPGEQLRVTVERIDPPYEGRVGTRVLIRPIAATLSSANDHMRRVEERAGRLIMDLGNGTTLHEDLFESKHRLVIVVRGRLIAFAWVDDVHRVGFREQASVNAFSILEPGYEIYYLLPLRSVPHIEQIDRDIKRSVEGFMVD